MSYGSMSSPYMSPRYGIWGENPYGAPTALGVGMSTSQGLGNIAETQARAGLINSQMQDQNIKNGMLQQVMPGLVSSTNATDAANTQTAVPVAQAKLGLLNYKNQYFPQNEDIALADSMTKALQQAAVQSRFSSPAYTFGKVTGGLTAPIKNAAYAQNPGAVNQMVSNVITPLLQPPTTGTQNTQTMNPAMALLSRHLPAGSQTMNSQAVTPADSTAQNPPTVAPTIANANAGLLSPGTAPGTTDAIQNAAQSALIKQVTTGDQLKRIQAGNRMNSLMGKMDQIFPSAAQFYGAGNKGKLLAAQVSSALGSTSPDYQNYMNMQQMLPIANSDLMSLTGGRSTDLSAKDVSTALNMNTWSTNPKAAQASWNNVKDYIGKMNAINKQSLPQQMSGNTANTGWQNGSYVHSDGKSYSRAELEALAKGGK